MLDIIKTRRSIRRYTDEPVTDETLQVLLEAARHAPSGKNQQLWRFVVVRDAAKRAELARINHEQLFLEKAQVHLVVCAEPRVTEGVRIEKTDEQSPELAVKQGIRDASIAATHILLQAEALGLGACWCGWHTQEAIRAALGIPEDKYVVGFIALGWPAETPNARPRKELRELVHYERWGGIVE